MGRVVTCLLACCAAASLLPVDGREARAFSLLADHGTSVADRIAQAARWSAEADPFGRGTGLHDGIQVAVEAGFAAGVGAAEVARLYGVPEAEVVALVEESVRRALQAWETPALRFEVEFDGPAVEGRTEGREIDLFARPLAGVTYFGFAEVEILPAEERLLTNGQRLPGDVIVGADIFLNRTRLEEGLALFSQVGLPLSYVAAALQILVAHELGHALGLGHPNENTFYDTDTDPYNEMTIDPLDPFADLIESAIPLDTPGPLLPVMWGGISRADPNDLIALLGRLEDPSLAFDDRGGRDVLYPAIVQPPCPGDCNGDGAVTIDELVRGVAIALGTLPVDACTTLDADENGEVRIDELVSAVNAALQGCPH